MGLAQQMPRPWRHCYMVESSSSYLFGDLYPSLLGLSGQMDHRTSPNGMMVLFTRAMTPFPLTWHMLGPIRTHFSLSNLLLSMNSDPPSAGSWCNWAPICLHTLGGQPTAIRWLHSPHNSTCPNPLGHGGFPLSKHSKLALGNQPLSHRPDPDHKCSDIWHRYSSQWWFL